jgi:hypothetical protein
MEISNKVALEVSPFGLVITHLAHSLYPMP